MADEPTRDTCLACGGEILWQPTSSSGRWLHTTRPVPDHDPEPTHIMFVSAEAWDQLLRELDEPPRVLPGLAALYARERRITVADDEPEP